MARRAEPRLPVSSGPSETAAADTKTPDAGGGQQPGEEKTVNDAMSLYAERRG